MTERVAAHPIDEIFVRRWSPRSFTGEAVSRDALLTVLEAARWAPSSYNSQPWRFVYALRDTEHWPAFLDLLIPFNRAWAEKAGALVLVISRLTMSVPGKEQPVPSHSHAFDTGAAWGYLALQAVRSGLVTHAMVGFDMDRAAELVGMPDGFRVEAIVAIGHQAPAEALPEPARSREAPTGRNPLESAAAEGRFPQ